MTPSEMPVCQTSPGPMSKHQQRYQRKKMAHSNLLITKKENEDKNIRLMKEVSEREHHLKCLQQLIQNHPCLFDAQTSRCSYTKPEMEMSPSQVSSEELASSALCLNQSCFPFLNNVNVPFPETHKVKDLPHEHHSHTDTRPTTFYPSCLDTAALPHDSNSPEHFQTGFQKHNLEERIDIACLNTQVPYFDFGPLMDISDVFPKTSSKDQSLSLHAYIRDGDLEGAFESLEYEASPVDILHSNDTAFLLGC